ncbi:MAG: DVUA0089 family protein [Myxococcota bacterium]|nr:DVUA0089 family protein [Myxococcota bacterium]
MISIRTYLSLLFLILFSVACGQSVIAPGEPVGVDDDDDASDDDDAASDDDDAASDDDDSQPSEGLCEPILAIGCDSTVAGDTAAAGATNAVDAYSCSTWDATGPEIAYAYTATSTGSVHAVLSEIEAGQDLDIYILQEDGNGCSGDSCITYGNIEADFDAQAGQTYYIVVDGYMGAQGSFVLEVGCGDVPPVDDDDDDSVPGDASAGDLVITEIFNNPSENSAFNGDDNREWVEVLNLSNSAIDLSGWSIQDFDADIHVVSGSVVVAPSSYVLLGSSTDQAANGGVAVDYSWGTDISLGNSSDELQLVSPAGVLVDEVVWDNGNTFPDPNGASMSLQPTSLDAADNDSGANWCVSSAAPFNSLGDIGSPGVTNPVCSTVPPVVDADGDGVPADQDCNDGNAGLFPGNTEIACDGYDQDCDGLDLLQDLDGDGVDCDTDCDDSNPFISPTEPEVPGNGEDDNCNGQIDENGPISAGCDANEMEPNNGYGNAGWMTLDTVMCGGISVAGDVDTFGIVVPQWTQLLIDVDAAILGSNLDSELYLLNGAGNVLQANDDDGNSVDSLINTIVVAAGTYYVSLNDYNNTGGANHNYELNIVTSSPCSTVELEPNESSSQADYAPVGGAACGEVSGPLDEDVFSFFASAGTSITFEVLSWDLGSTLGSQLTLFDTDGSTELADDEPGGFGDPSLSYTFTSTGTYYIEVASDLWLINDTGPYLLTLD